MASVAPIGSTSISTHSADSKAAECQHLDERRKNLDGNNQKSLNCSMVDCVYQILCAPICGVIGCLICFSECCCVRYGDDKTLHNHAEGM